MRSTRFAWQTEHAFPDDVALDLVGTGPDRTGLVVEPRALPGPVTRVVVGTAPEWLSVADHRHSRFVQALTHFAPPQFVDAAHRARIAALRRPGNRSPIVQLEHAHLDERLCQAGREARVVE